MSSAGAMTFDFDPWLSSQVAADVALASHADAQGLAARQSQRLALLTAGAARDSAFYRRRYAGLDLAHARLQDLPVVHKHELMHEFDAWVTDRALRLDDLRRFVADTDRIAEPYLGRYVVWQSSGSSGEAGIFVHDPHAMAVCDAIEALRRPLSRPLQRMVDPFYLSERIAFVGATNGHFASTVSVRRLRRLNPTFGAHLRDLSFLNPIEQLVRELNAWAPTIIATYPSEALWLAEEYQAGRLRTGLREMWTGGETLTPATRHFIQQAFGCTVIDSYGASEFLTIASECAHGRLHLNSDWVILESVDEQGRAVAPGTFGATALLTNLANRVQPLIRYDLGDRVAFAAERCACGSHLPALSVQGRSADFLLLQRADGRPLRVLSLAISTVLEEDAGLFDFQLRQLGPRELQLGTCLSGAEAQAALRRAQTVLKAFLSQQGAGRVEIHCVSGRAHRHGRGGKVQRVVAGRPARH
jgi:phenylacetate-coenzyme A ligase PaaK-like adenylate-forming protein